MYQEKNNAQDLYLLENSHFELREGFEGEKNINLCNRSPLKYTALVTNSNLDLQVNTTQEGSVLELFLLAPIVEGRACRINLGLNLLHSNCQIDLKVVVLAFSDAKTEVKATIYMQPGIQESGSNLLEETVILGNAVNITQLPVLDIQANNISASHGAKIYRLDSQKLFYLQSKGLSAIQARNLLISSYPAMLIDGVFLEEEGEKIKNRIISNFLTFDTMNQNVY